MSAVAVREKPILFSGPMVRAILAGQKTQTRRVVKPQPINFDGIDAWEYGPYRAGQCLWVRETFAIETNYNCDFVLNDGPNKPLGPVRWQENDEQRWYECPRYRASEPDCELVTDDQDLDDYRMRWRPSIFMPRWASRLILEVVDVRVERVQQISDAEVLSEGFTEGDARDRRCRFVETWNRLNGGRRGYPWGNNPWIWVVSFRRVEATA